MGNREWFKGYEDQEAWLRGQRMSIPAAHQTLEAREATLEATCYNLGGTEATNDYIVAEMTRAIADTARKADRK